MVRVNSDVEAMAKAFDNLRRRKLRISKKGNPQRAGTAARARWDWLLKNAKRNGSVGDYLTSKGHPVTLRNAIKRGFVELV
ncbi:hypothetical protein JQ580_29895 [Bradyrhizobium japonicum]|uniref:hypothetical protein n=1 Tax=Bradyrhizobium japonicum TaxID=375 RepID=UPI001BA8AB58|nr:hypothetical protein [Bradyrhizobium japonicum]MBR0994929.1 hypothetical protein [Bradyrhizobium japonicum]